jgi:hypothetical protein
MNTQIKFPPPRFIWKKFSEEMPAPKNFGLYLLWDENTGEGTLRTVHTQTCYSLSFSLWKAEYTHWTFFKKKKKRDHYV